MAGEILTQRELRRYSKQIMIPEIGTAGQEKLKKSKVLVVGAGGLGCPVLQYLVAAGVGKVAIAEYDMVSETNLQRQILYGSDDVGKLKSIIAKNRLDHLNSLVETEIFNLRLDASNALRIIKDFDIVVDATDNPGQGISSMMHALFSINQWSTGPFINSRDRFPFLILKGDRHTGATTRQLMIRNF